MYISDILTIQHGCRKKKRVKVISIKLLNTTHLKRVTSQCSDNTDSNGHKPGEYQLGCYRWTELDLFCDHVCSVFVTIEYIFLNSKMAVNYDTILDVSDQCGHGRD